MDGTALSAHGATGPAAEVAASAQLACLLEATVPKPGNVSPSAGFFDMDYRDFVMSAVAIGPAFTWAGRLPVGEVVLRAIRDTRRLVAANTNLGLVLLLAPLAAAEVRGTGDRQTAVRRVLEECTREDTRAVYEAIRLAGAGGLGRVARHDVATRSPAVSLPEAMREAAERDSVAKEYATGFETTFMLAAPAVRTLWARGLDARAVVLRAFLTILAAVPDTLIARKRGRAVAEEIASEAAAALRAAGRASGRDVDAVTRLDRRLRSQGNALNPGATADLLAAALFVLLREDETFVSAVKREVLGLEGGP